MKNTAKKCLLFLLSFSFIFLSGCEMLMVPFQFIFFILGSTVTLFFRLLPIAAKLLPLALLLVRVSNEELKDNNVRNDIEIVYNSADNDSNNYPDAMRIIQSNFEKKNNGKYIIFSFDAGTDEKEMKKIIKKELIGKQILSAECYMANGASLYNDKFGFYLLLDEMKKEGITLKSHDCLKPTVDLFYKGQNS